MTKYVSIRHRQSCRLRGRAACTRRSSGGATAMTASPGRAPRRMRTTCSRTWLLRSAGELLAVGKASSGTGGADADLHVERPGLEQLPGVAPHLHVAVPADERPVGAAERHAVQPRVDERQRLHDGPPAGAAPGSAFPTGLAAANSEVLNGSTRLPSLEVPSANSTMVSPCARRAPISLGGLADRGPRGAIDEHRALQPGQRGDERPAAPSFLATNDTGATADSTGISSHDV